jgi:hypothetical protein
MRAATTCLIVHDRVKYRVDAKPAEVVADHPRSFRRDQVVYDPWHYSPVLMFKPGRFRNSALFKDWDLPTPRWAIRTRLQHRVDGVRQFVKIPRPRGGRCHRHGVGLREAMEGGIANGDVVLD